VSPDARLAAAVAPVSHRTRLRYLPRDQPEAASGGLRPANRPPTGASAVVEFLNLVLILIAALFVLRKPEKERTAFRMLVVSSLLMVFLFTLATRSGLLPGLNY
jgi:hypothetical protein